LFGFHFVIAGLAKSTEAMTKKKGLINQAATEIPEIERETKLNSLFV